MMIKNNLQQFIQIFGLTYLAKWVHKRHSHSTDHLDYFGPEDMILMSETSYNQLPLTSFPFMKFKISNKLYCKWLDKHSCNIFYKVDLSDITESLDSCEKLFDKNVLPIKKLVKDIGDLDNLMVKETKNVYLYDDSNFSTL